jgi:hypothetical protein
MVKAAWFRNYAAHKRPEKFDGVVQSWDIANKASELRGSHHTAAVTKSDSRHLSDGDGSPCHTI